MFIYALGLYCKTKIKIMKTFTPAFLITLAFILLAFKPLKQGLIKLPYVTLTNLEGKSIQIQELKSDKTIIICFWSVLDEASIRSVNAIYENYTLKKMKLE